MFLRQKTVYQILKIVKLKWTLHIFIRKKVQIQHIIFLCVWDGMGMGMGDGRWGGKGKGGRTRKKKTRKYKSWIKNDT